MIRTKDLFQEMLDRQIETEAKAQGLTVEDLLIMKAEEEAEEQHERDVEQQNQFCMFNLSL